MLTVLFKPVDAKADMKDFSGESDVPWVIRSDFSIPAPSPPPTTTRRMMTVVSKPSGSRRQWHLRPDCEHPWVEVLNRRYQLGFSFVKLYFINVNNLILLCRSYVSASRKCYKRTVLGTQTIRGAKVASDI